jgi:putative Holliday junction resolvase
MTRIVGIDLGERRIGIAIADDDGRARPLSTVARSASAAEDLDAIERAAGGRPAELVLGLPLDMSGGEGSQATATRAWAVDVERVLGAAVPIRLRDERLTSHLAEARLGPMKRGRNGGPPTPAQRRAYRERVDREAAAIILQDELDARAAQVAR